MILKNKSVTYCSFPILVILVTDMYEIFLDCGMLIPNQKCGIWFPFSRDLTGFPMAITSL